MYLPKGPDGVKVTQSKAILRYLGRRSNPYISYIIYIIYMFHALHHQRVITSWTPNVNFTSLLSRHGLEGKTEEEQVWNVNSIYLPNVSMISDNFPIKGEDRLAGRHLDRLHTSPYWSLLQVAENFYQCDENVCTLTMKIWCIPRIFKPYFCIS